MFSVEYTAWIQCIHLGDFFLLFCVIVAAVASEECEARTILNHTVIAFECAPRRKEKERDRTRGRRGLALVAFAFLPLHDELAVSGAKCYSRLRRLNCHSHTSEVTGPSPGDTMAPGPSTTFFEPPHGAAREMFWGGTLGTA